MPYSSLSKNDRKFHALGGLSMILSSLIFFTAVLLMGATHYILGYIPIIVEAIFIASLAIPLAGLAISILYGAGKELYKLWLRL